MQIVLGNNKKHVSISFEYYLFLGSFYYSISNEIEIFFCLYFFISLYRHVIDFTDLKLNFNSVIVRYYLLEIS